MKLLFSAMAVFSFVHLSHAQEAVVDVVLHPAGSFKAKSAEVKGSVKKVGDKFVAENISVGLKNITTQISLRDKHTKKYLEVEKFPEAVLVSGEGKGGKGTGVIRIKGIEKPIQGTYEVKATTFTATFPLKLSDFKIEGIKYMGVGVDDKVTLHVSVPIKK